MAVPNYDLMVHRDNEDSFGYMCEWGGEESAPMTVTSDPPDVPVSTSSGVVTSGGPFSARDAALPYPIEICNWQDGAGQESYDNVESSAEAFRMSRNVDVTQASHFELGSRVFHFPDTTAEDTIFSALGTFWAGFTPVTLVKAPPESLMLQPASVKFLVRYELTSVAATYYLIDDDDTRLDVVGATGHADRGSAYTGIGVAVNDYLYCPTHNEVVKVTNVATANLTVTRGQCGTTAIAHSASEKWYGFGWRAVTFDATDAPTFYPPEQSVSAFATDGKYVYASFTDLAGNNGSVWRGTQSGSWTRWAEADNITNMVQAGGYIYATQDLYNDITKAGYFAVAGTLPSDLGTFTALSLSGAMQWSWNSAGLAASNNYAYWAVTDGYSKSAVYKIHNSTDDPFELVSPLPDGFIATHAYGHLGSVYIGGYFDNLDNLTGDTGLPQYEGAVFLVADNTLMLSARFRTSYDQESPYDTRVKGMASAGPYLLVLTVDDTYVYDTQHGAWSHGYNTSTGSVSSVSAEEDWVDETAYPAFLWFSSDGTPAATTVQTVYTGWDTDTNGFIDAGFISNDADTAADFEATDYGTYKNFKTGASVVPHRYKVDAKKWKKWVVSGGLNATDQKGTLVAVVKGLQSQAGNLIMCDGVKEARVAMRGVMSDGKVVKYQFGVGWMKNVNGDAWDYEYEWGGKIEPKVTVLRMVYSPTGVTLYVNGKNYKSIARAKLRNSSTAQVQWTVGWPGQMSRAAYNSEDDYNEKICYLYLNFSAVDAYTPDGTIGGVNTVTDMRGIAHAQGITYIPIPGGGFDCIDNREIATEGFLETSDSAFHMGSVLKYFTSVVVEHSPLQDGQSIYITPIKDDVPTGSTSYVADILDTDDSLNVGRVTSTALVNAQGKKIRARVEIRDDNPARPYVYRLRVFRITTKFFPVNSPHVHVYYLNCREGVQCRTGRDWGYDPEEAIRHLFSAADSGEVVHIESLFTSNVVDDVTGEVGLQKARLESVKLYQGPGDMQKYNKLTGTVQVKLRRVDL